MTQPRIVPLQLAGVGKRFGRVSVLRRVDLQVGAGEVVGLLGANGAGKTTLLAIIGGLLAASAGTVRLGQLASPLALSDRGALGFVAHTAQLYPRLDARENLELFASLRRAAGLPSAEPRALVERLGLAHAGTRLVGSFSRGMMQRLALARALLGQPQLLLLDEPFTALDRPGRRLLARVLLEERARGVAVLLSSHDFDAVASVTDRAVLLERGVIAGEARRPMSEPGETVEAGAAREPSLCDGESQGADERYHRAVYDLAGQLDRGGLAAASEP